MRMATGWKLLSGIVKRLWRDASGISLIYVTVALPALMGVSLLAVDVGRLWSLQSSLQHAADSIALATAGELDRQPDALTRANLAKDNLVSNPAIFATGVARIDGSGVTASYLRSLPASDALPIQPENRTNNPTEARYVEITVTPVTFTTLFPATFLGAAANTAQASATAVAGFDLAVCDFTPVYMCNPYETNTNTDEFDTVELMNHFDRVNHPERIGRAIRLRQTGGANPQYIPGNFGFLQPNPPNNPTASELRELVGVDRPPACFSRNAVHLRSGPTVPVRFGFNVRFDLYDGPMSSRRNDISYRPAQNVRKGMATDKTSGSDGTPCDPDYLDVDDGEEDFASELRKDECFYNPGAGNCPHAGGRMGDGDWGKQTYWNRSHNRALDAPLPGPVSGQHVSRFDVYNHELNAPGDLDIDSNGPPEGGERGRPGCYGGGANTLSDTPDRRIFQAAVLNCRALVSNAKLGGGADNPVPVAAFARFFLTEHVASANADEDRKDDDRADPSVPDGDVWVEMMGASEGRDMVQLYR